MSRALMIPITEPGGARLSIVHSSLSAKPFQTSGSDRKPGQAGRSSCCAPGAPHEARVLVADIGAVVDALAGRGEVIVSPQYSAMRRPSSRWMVMGVS